MRKELNELSVMAKDLRDIIFDYRPLLESNPVVISDRIKAFVTKDFINFHFSAFPDKVEIGVYKDNIFEQVNVNIDIDRVTDEDLDELVLQSKKEIAIFKKSFAKQVKSNREAKILELKSQLEKLCKEDVQTS